MFGKIADLQAEISPNQPVQISRATSGPVIDPEYWTTFTCEDPLFSANLVVIAEQANLRFELPPIAPQKQTVSLADTAPCLIKRLCSFLGVATPREKHVSDATLILAAALKIAVVLLIFTYFAKAKRLGQIPTEIEEFQKSVQSRSEQELERDRWYAEALAAHTWDQRLDGRILMVPQNGSIEAYMEAERLRRMHPGLQGLFPSVPLVELDPPWSVALRPKFGALPVTNCPPFSHWRTAGADIIEHRSWGYIDRGECLLHPRQR